MKLAGKGAQTVVESMDRRFSTNKRSGKRKKRVIPSYAEHRTCKGRSWHGLATFTLLSALLFAFTASAGATQACVTGATGVELAAHALGTGGLIANVSGQHGLRQQRGPGQPEDDRIYAPNLASALASVESFSFDGKVAVTAYERYQKDAEGGWIWGNSVHMQPIARGLALSPPPAART